MGHAERLRAQRQVRERAARAAAAADPTQSGTSEQVALASAALRKLFGDCEGLVAALGSAARERAALEQEHIELLQTALRKVSALVERMLVPVETAASGPPQGEPPRDAAPNNQE